VSEFEVVIEEIRKAAQAATSAGEQARRVDLAEALSGVGSGFIGPAAPAGLALALPRSKSAENAPKVCAKLRGDIDKWVAEIYQYAQNLTSSADLYATNEEQARQNLTPFHRAPNRAV